MQSPYNQYRQQLRERAQVAGLLTRLLDHHTLLTVSMPGVDALYNTAVLAVDPAKARFQLDELNPREGHEMLRPGTTVTVEGRPRGILTRFDAKVLDVGIEHDIYYYDVQFPAEILYYQRREHHRVPVQLALHATISIAGRPVTARARLIDLSVSGIGAIAISGTGLSHGQEYVCTLELPERPHLIVPADIRFINTEKTVQQQRFGARFLHVPKHERRTLERFVAELQRDLLRKGTAGEAPF